MPPRNKRDDTKPEKTTWASRLGIAAAILLGLVAVEEAATKLISGAPPLLSAVRGLFAPPWRDVLVNLNGGSASLPDGYEMRNIRYRNLAPSRDRHQFSFDIHGPNGLVKANIPYVGDNDGQLRKSLVDFDNHRLEFGFSNWNDGSGRLHFSWR